MISQKQLQALAKKHGTPLFIVDHDEIRKNYAQFKKYLPRVQAYYAVKAEPLPEIVQTLYKAGASFDVASMPEFLIVHENIKKMPNKKRLAWIWDKIIYANPIKPNETLRQLDPYRPLVTFDNIEEIHKVKKYAPHAGMVLRIRVPNTGAVVELSSKFGAAPGEAVDLILAAEKAGLGVEGLSFHVGSQTTNFENFVQAINLAADIFKEAKERGHTRMNLLDIGGGFPAPYDASVKPFRELATKINSEINRLFPKNIEILAEPGRFMIATAGTSVVKINGKAVRDGKTCYYVDDGAYHTYSGIIFDHQHCHMKSFRKGPEQICGVFGALPERFHMAVLV
ncbi:MAG: decarboxylase, partial [Elusimicrobia bacterium RIFOXYA2_FULL_58_8]